MGKKEGWSVRCNMRSKTKITVSQLIRCAKKFVPAERFFLDTGEKCKNQVIVEITDYFLGLTFVKDMKEEWDEFRVSQDTVGLLDSKRGERGEEEEDLDGDSENGDESEGECLGEEDVDGDGSDENENGSESP